MWLELQAYTDKLITVDTSLPLLAFPEAVVDILYRIYQKVSSLQIYSYNHADSDKQ